MELFESAQATVNADGRSECRLQPLRAFETWTVTKMTVQSTSVGQSQCRVYRGSESPSRLIEGTYSGNMDSSDTSIQLRNGESLLAVWTKADPGSVCTFTVEGRSARK